MFAPYKVKKLVLDSAVSSALLYSCESWLSGDLRCVDNAVITCIRSLLGVRNQTIIDILYTETGIAPASIQVRTRQINFFNKYLSNGSLRDSPLSRAMGMAITARTPMGRYIIDLENDAGSLLHKSVTATQQRILTSTKTRMETYKQFNSDLLVHPVYKSTDTALSEWARIHFTRMRLSSHYLHIETGRWCRLPRHRRLCICGHVQSEEHVLLECMETAELRQKYNSLGFNSITELMCSDPVSLCQYCLEILVKMNNNY